MAPFATEGAHFLMKRYVGLLAVIALAITGTVVASRKISTKTVEADRAEDIGRIKAEYLERVGWIRSNPDEKSYKDEVGTFLRWYFKEINDHRNRFGGKKDYDEYLDELAKRSDKDEEAKRAMYEHVKKTFDLLRTNYQPQWSATDKGMRLDIVSTQLVPGADPKVRYQIVLWGAQRQMREDNRTKRMVTSSSFNVTWKLYDEKGVLIGEMNAAGDPAMKVDWPERYISVFPPQMVFGHYDIDRFPEKTKTVEMVWNVASRAPTGGDVAATYTWKLDAPAEWKLGAGEEWKGAQESVRPEEEINPKKAQR